MSNDIKQLWKILRCDEDSVLELRAISKEDGVAPASKIFRTSNFKSIEDCRRAFEHQAMKLNLQGFNCYFVMNPISDNFLGRSAKDADISCRTTLLVDIDRAGNTKDPATDAELSECKKVADKVANWFRDNDEEPIAVVMSGNGYHLYYCIDLPNDETSKQLITTLLKKLAAQFDNEQAKIDTAVGNASRISKIPGTLSRKGIETADRPYRRAHLC